MNWPLLQNSLVVAALTVLVSVALGFTAALCLAGVAARWRQRWLGLAIVALAMPPFLVTNCWLDLLGDSGLLHGWLPVRIYSLGGTVWILVLLTWPLSLLATLTAWHRLEPSQLESEPALRGAALIRWLLWPVARKAVGLAAALTLVLALNNFTVPAILQVPVLPAEMWVSFNTNLDSFAALRLGWPLVVVPLALVLVLGRRETGRWPRLEGGVEARLFRRQLGTGWFVLSAGLTVLLMILSAGAPLAQLVLHRRTWLELLPALAAGTNALGNSLFHAGATATLTVGIALFVSAHRGARPTRVKKELRNSGKDGLPLCSFPQFRLPFFAPRFVEDPAREYARPTRLAPLLWLPLFVPGIFLGLALIWGLNRPGCDWFYRSAGVVLLALALRYFAPACFGAGLALRSVDRDLIDNARLDGASGWGLFRLVQWPQIKTQVAAVWYVIYLLSLWDVETLVLILPPGGETLALRVFNLLHYGHSAQVNALCVWLLMVAVLPLAVWQVAGRVSALRLTRCAPRAARAALAGLVGGFVLAGCTPQTSPNSAPVQSQFFSRVEIIGSRGAGSGEFNKPRSLAVDTNDNLYVADMTGRVQKFSPDGKFLLSWQMPQTELGKPKGMARDRDGNIVVIEPHYQRVNHFSPDGKLLAQWGGHVTNGGPFSLPRAVAVNSRGDVIVSEYTLFERVQVFSARGGKRLLAFGQAGNASGSFNRPEGVGVDAADRIYVADSCNHRIQVFSPDGKLLRAHGQAGRSPGDLSYPYDICVDASGRQFVCEFGNSRIQIFDAKDQPLEILGSAGGQPGRFANPWSIVLDSKGNLYVADSQNHRVQKFIASPKSKVQSPKSSARGYAPVNGDVLVPEARPAVSQLATRQAPLTLDIGHWTLDSSPQ